MCVNAAPDNRVRAPGRHCECRRVSGPTRRAYRAIARLALPACSEMCVRHVPHDRKDHGQEQASRRQGQKGRRRAASVVASAIESAMSELQRDRSRSSKALVAAGLERQFCRPQDEAAGSFQTKPAFPSTATAGVARPPSVSVPNVAPGNPLGGCGRGRTRDPKMESPQRKCVSGLFSCANSYMVSSHEEFPQFPCWACRAQRRCRH